MTSWYNSDEEYKSSDTDKMSVSVTSSDSEAGDHNTIQSITKLQIHKETDIEKDGEELIFDPYNPNNHEITETDVNVILKKYGLPSKVHNINLYKRAFIHKSYVKKPHLENELSGVTVVDKPDDCLPLKTKSNERLEFLGDGVLECITKYYLYRRFPKADEGFMTEKKIAIVKNEHIGRLAYEMGLHKWYIISKNAEEKGIRQNMKKLGCLFESFLGALFLDFNKIQIHDDDKWFDQFFVTGPGLQMSQIFVESIFEKHINWFKLIQDDDNYKTLLQVKIQKVFKQTPIYLIIDSDEENGYTMGVYICLNTPVQKIKPEYADTTLSTQKHIDLNQLQTQYESTGQLFCLLAQESHKTKKKAEQLACYNALQKLIKDTIKS
jgi:dsRNA-specific ribonuclease